MASSTPSTTLTKRSNDTALTKRSNDTALMPPPPPPKRIKRPATVLEEDVYTDALSHIIARDFFPGLLESETTQEYLDAIDAQDSAWIAEAGRKLTEVMTPGPDGRRLRGRRGTSMTPSFGRGTSQAPRGSVFGGDTPLSVAGSDVSTSCTARTASAPDVDVNMSLSAFQAKYTSEDNESFNALLDKQNAKRAQKYAWMWAGNKIPSGRQIAHRARQQQLLGDASSDTAVAIRPHPDTRPAMPDTASSTQGPRNAFMFGGPDVSDTHPTLTSTAAAAAAASTAPPKTLHYPATRLPPPPQPPSSSDTTIPPSPSLSAIDAALAGRIRPTATEAADSDLYTGAETPRVAGYAFVDEEPTPEELGIPVSDGEAQALDTAALLARLSGGGTSEAEGPNRNRNLFSLQAASRRETLHHRMVEKTNAGRRASAAGAGAGAGGGGGGGGGGGAGGRVAALRGSASATGAAQRTPTPGFASRTGTGSASMTPAARKLLERMRTPTRSDGGTFGSGSRGRKGGAGTTTTKERWTPRATPKSAVGK
ncbi:nuclear protein DGCR14 [Cryomyces antarcticus]